MARLKKYVVDFLKKEDGPTAVECALMLALVIVVCIVAINTVQPNKPSMDEPVVETSARHG